ncbi:Shwachman-Bodian-Diamond protein-like protein [Balamuthia mandrillaris]
MSFQVVRHKVDRTTFEVLCKPGAALKFREGKLGWSNVLFSDEIFTDQSKGQRANESDLQKAFDTSNQDDIAKLIVEKGELQLSAAERKAKVDKKRAEMVNYIHKYFIDPRTKTPHPVVRIENAFTQLKITVDPDMPAERQVQDKVLKRLPEVLPIKKCEMEGVLVVSHQFLGQAMGLVKKYASVAGEKYTSEGCEMQVAIVPGGSSFHLLSSFPKLHPFHSLVCFAFNADYDTFMSELRDATKGNFQFDVIGQGGPSDEAGESSGGGKGKGKGKRGGGGGGRGGGRGSRGRK